jgi:hypothetical protein
MVAYDIGRGFLDSACSKFFDVHFLDAAIFHKCSESRIQLSAISQLSVVRNTFEYQSDQIPLIAALSRFSY